ncbi:MAG: hypothetical protein JWP61_785 [Friedmanniella sp.]|nr:hypothetical protein [Friedmanniella sp.]
MTRVALAPGFHPSPTDPTYPQVGLRVISFRRFQVIGSFGFTDRDGSWWEVPAHAPGASTDLASAPAWLWGLTASYGRQLYPALLHDRRSDQALLLRPSDPTQAYADRLAADRQFYRALRLQGLAPIRASMFWAAVTLNRFLRMGRVPAGLAFLAQMVAVLVGVGTAVGLAVAGSGAGGWHNPGRWLLLAAAAVVPAVLYGRSSVLPVAVGCLAAPVVGVVLVVTFAAAVLLWLPDLAITAVTRLAAGGHPPGPPTPWPRPHPYLRETEPPATPEK